MLTFESLPEVDFATVSDEETSAFSLPTSNAELHETRNPFNTEKAAPVDDDVTPKCAFIPQKLLRPAAATVSDSFEKKCEELMSESKTVSSDETETKSSASPPIDALTDQSKVLMTSTARPAIKVTPYQTKLTPELCQSFERLEKFETLPEEIVARYKVNLKPQNPKMLPPKKTLVIDLDGTLICGTHRARPRGCDTAPLPEIANTIRVTEEGATAPVSFYVRPYALRLLKVLHVFYEIVVFTAGKLGYAKAIVDHLDPHRRCIDYIMHRSHCISLRDAVVKDLRVIGRRNLSEIIILDNTVMSFASQLSNGIYVPTFEGDATDTELLPIIDFLKSIAGVDDVRPYVKEFAGIEKLFAEYKAYKACLL